MSNEYEPDHWTPSPQRDRWIVAGFVIMLVAIIIGTVLLMGLR